MKHFTVSEIVLSKYKSISGPNPEEVVGGSRPRLNFVHKKTGQLFFFKTYSKNPREVWAECLASHIAEAMGLKAQTVTIKTAPLRLEESLRKMYPEQLPNNWKPVGTLARNLFPKNIEITYGAAIVGTPTKALTLEDIESKVRKRYYAADDLLQDFADMTVLDIMLGNMDRHHENWGVCEDEKYKQQLLVDKKRLIKLRYFTPLFDHGSSLMFELGQDQVKSMLDDSAILRNYIEEAKFGFILDIYGAKNNMFTIIRQHIENGTSWKKRFILSIEKVSSLDLLNVASLIIQMPSLDLLEYDNDRRKLLYKAILLRYNILIGISR